jgi:flagellar biosynthesis/type III secretory pathway protein FliH
MDNSERNSVLMAAVDNFGEEIQLVIATEELSELIKELCKYLRGYKNEKRIKEEMADVSIMMGQINYILNTKNGEIDHYIDQKLLRLKDRILKHLQNTVPLKEDEDDNRI